MRFRMGSGVALTLGLALCSTLSAQVIWEDNFDAYGTGSTIAGQGTWETWDLNPIVDAPVTDIQSRSAPNSLFIEGDSDIVTTWTTLTAGNYVMTAWVYVPSTQTGDCYYIMLNDYNPGGPYNWSLQLLFNAVDGTVSDLGGSAGGPGAGGTLPVVVDAWSEIRVEIDVDSNTHSIYYDGQLLRCGDIWSGALSAIECIDLYGGLGSGIYFDDLMLEETTCVAPQNLSCTIDCTTLDTLLSWDLGDTYTGIDIYDNGVLSTSLAGTEVSAVLTLAAGDHTIQVVGNCASGDSLSACCQVNVAPCREALVHSGGAFSTDRETSAMDLLGRTYDFVTSEADAVAMMASNSYELVVWVQPNFLMGDSGAQALIDYVAGGGKVVFSYWDLDGSSGAFPLLTDLMTTFGVSSATGMTPGLPVYPEASSGTHPIWDGPIGTLTQLDIVPVGYGDHGDFLVASTGTPIATFDPTGDASTQACVILDNADATAVNSFTHEEIDVTQIVPFLANEFLHVTGWAPPCPGPTDLVCTTVLCPDGDVELSWINPGGLDSIEIDRSGTIVATLAGTATSYTDPAVPSGGYLYTVRATCTGTGDPAIPASCQIGHCLNDTCDSAFDATDGVYTFDTTGASPTGTGPTCPFGGASSPDLWWRYVATCDGAMRAETCGSSYDTALAAYDACGGTEIACNDDSCGLQSVITVPVSVGDEVWVEVSGYNGASGAGTLTFSCVPVAANDDCTGAIPVALDVPEPFDTAGAVVASTPASCFFGTPNDLWYSIDSAVDGYFRASTCAGGGDTQLAVYDACGGLELACGDDNCGLSSEITFPVVTGATYYIQCAGWGAGTAASELLVTEVFPAGNDTCDLATPIDLDVPEPFDTSTGVIAGPSASCWTGTQVDLWYSVTVPTDGTYKASTCAGGGDTQLAVYDACGGVELGCNDDSCGFASEVTWTGTAGSTYYIQVAGWNGATVASELLVSEFIIQPTLIHSGGAFDTTREAQAMDLLGLPYTLVTTAGAASDLMAGTTFDLVIWVQPNFLMGDAEAQLLMDYVALEGKVLFSYWDLDGSSSGFPLLADLRTTFGVASAVDDFGTQNPVYPEASSGSHPVWDGTGGTFTELTTVPVGYGDHGDFMVASTGTAVGTFDATGDASTQACIIIDNADRTLVNSFTHEDIDGIQIAGFLANEIEFLNGGGPIGTEFVRGDANDDGNYDISDAVFTLSALFVPGSPAPNCLDSADSNDDGNFDISDAVFSLSALFVPGSPAPPAPHPACGIDETDTDPLDCACFNSCGTPCP